MDGLKLVDINLCVYAPPGGQRAIVDPRATRHESHRGCSGNSRRF
jgi:hypothetical protein